MKGNTVLQLLTLLVCIGLAAFAYESSKEISQLHAENEAIWTKLDSLQNLKPAPAATRKVATTNQKAASFYDELISDLTREYREAKKAGERSKIVVSSSYRLEDRYVSSYMLYLPETVGEEAGTVVVNISVDKIGNVKKTSIASADGITNEDVLEACRKAALKTDFNYDSSAKDLLDGTITYTFAKKLQ